MVSRSLSSELRQAQASVVALARADLADAWSALDLSLPAAARDALLRTVPAISTHYGAAGAAIAADWYDRARVADGVPGAFRALAAPPTPTAWVESSVGFSAQHLWTSDPSPMVKYLYAALTKHVAQPMRDTIRGSVAADPRASGWQRNARADGCTFCQFLAQRGAVYKRATVDFAAHKACNCYATPSWDPGAPEVSVQAYRASARTSRMSPEARERHRASIRRYLAEFRES